MKHDKIKMHKKMAMSGKSPVGKMGGGMMKPTGYKKGGMSAGDKFNAKVKGMLDTYDDKNTPMKKDRFKEKLKASGKMGGGMMQRPAMKKGGRVRKPVTVKEITPKGKKGVLIFKGKAKDYKNVGKSK
jgi:hypothetical protein